MPTEVTAKTGDCLCVIAMQNGFLNCQPLRDEPKNAAFLNRPLADGDVVTVPDIRARGENKSTDSPHTFVKKNSPPVSIRYVHGSPDKHYLDDTETFILNVSNFQTDKGGSDGKAPFPDQFEFHQEGHVDPDTFKVEVVDPDAGGGPIKVTLDQRMPEYELVGGKLKVKGFRKFEDTVGQIPPTTVPCALVHSAVSFRSKYMRVVTNSGDLTAKVLQTMFVASVADGKGTGAAGDPDNVEILDFEIRATYVIQRCPAPTKCSVSVSRPVGDESEQLRFRIAVHIFKERGTGNPIGGLTVQKVRKRLLRNLRAFYAQASMAPKFVSADGSDGGPPIIFMDAPDDNMITIGENTGRGASGRTVRDEQPTLQIFDAGPTTIATIPIPRKRQTPTEIGNLIAGALDSNTFKVEVFPTEVQGGPATIPACDVMITRLDGTQLTLGVLTDDTVLRNNITVARVSIDEIDDTKGPDLRRIIRSSPGPEGVINLYAIGVFKSTTGALSFPLDADFPANMHRFAPIVNSTITAAQFLDDRSDFANAIPHECGHILGDVNHVPKFDPHFESELMNPFTDETNDVDGHKRISDKPILVHYTLLDPASSSPLINATQRFRTRSPNLTESW